MGPQAGRAPLTTGPSVLVQPARIRLSPIPVDSSTKGRRHARRHRRPGLRGRTGGCPKVDARHVTAGTDILSAVTDGVVELALVGAGRMGRMHLRALDPAGGGGGGPRDRRGRADRGRQRGVARQGYRLHPRSRTCSSPGGRTASSWRPRRIATRARPRCARRRDPRPVREACRVDVAGDRGDRTRRRRRGVAFQVAYWRRFVPAMVALRERIVAGELGQILHLVCAQWDGAPPPAQFRRSSGGAFVDMGVHEFDVVRWLTGQSVASVAAVQTPALDPRARPDADNAQALLSLSGGATAAVSLGRHHPGGDLVTIEVFGSAGHERSTVLDPATATSPCWTRSPGKQTRSPSWSGAGAVAVRERRTPLRRCRLPLGRRRRCAGAPWP